MPSEATKSESVIVVVRPERHPDPPTLPAKRTGRGTVRIWCKYCDYYHQHGEPEPDMVRHRLAHCWVDDSPYRETGYVLEPVEWDPKPPPSERRKPRYVGNRILHGWEARR